MERLTQQLISYADLPPEVVAHSRRVFTDSIGCAFGGPQKP